MFVIIYQPSTGPVEVKRTATGFQLKGHWLVGTEDDGSLAMIEELDVAVASVKDIRSKGGEACLGVVIE